MRVILNKLINKFGYALVKKSYYPDCFDMSPETEPVFSRLEKKVVDFTMTSKERRYALYQSVRYIIENKIPGDIVECGVWKGGSMMLAALTLLELGDTSRSLYLYDTFEGMSEPSDKDLDYGGKSAEQGLADLNIKEYSEWCYSSYEEVKKNILSIGYPEEKIFL